MFDAQWLRPRGSGATRAAAEESGSKRQACIDIGGGARRSSDACDDLDSLVA
jgi:hypothetical protein